MDDQEQFLSRSQQARRYNKNYRTIERWGKDVELGYPSEIEIRGRFFRKLSELEEFERRRAGLIRTPPQYGFVKKKTA